MIMYHHSEDIFHIYVTVELKYVWQKKAKTKASNFKVCKKKINPYSKVHRSFEQKDYELNHINNSCSVKMLHIFIKSVHFQLMDIQIYRAKGGEIYVQYLQYTYTYKAYKVNHRKRFYFGYISNMYM